MRKTIILLTLLALSLSACGSTDSSAGELSQPESTTTVATTLSAPNENESESANDEASRIDGSEEENSFSITTSAPSESITEETPVEEETTTETTGSTSRTETTSEPKATTTSKAVTSSATTTTKKATTTTKAVAQTTTTTKKAATTTTTAKQATTTTTTKKTTTTTTQAASTVEWTPLLRAYQHYTEATFTVRDDMDLYDSSKITSAELEMIRKDICDYGLSFNGKQVVTLWTANGTKTIDFLRPLELTVDTSLTCYLQGSIVLGDAHLNAGTGWTYIGKSNYEKMTEEQKYQTIVDVREKCLKGVEYCFYRWYDYAGQAYAYIMTYNFGFLANGAEFWFLTK